MIGLDLKITENLKEIVEIGRNICSSMDKVYTPEMLSTIKKTIDTYMRDSDEVSKDEMLYRSIYDYWAYGNSVSEEFYMGFKDKSRDERLQYVPFRWRLKYIWEINDRGDEHYFGNKYETYQLLKSHYMRDVIEISGEDDYKNFLKFLEKHPIFVAKPTFLSCGIGVYKVDSNEYSDKHVLFNKLLNDGKDAVQGVNWSQSSTVVLEELIDQVDELAAIHPYSCNGIRITTLRQGNNVHILYPWFKIGANKGFVTSAALGTYDAGIDPITGIVNTDGFKEDGSSESIHPLTGINFKGYRIPKWKELIDLVSELSYTLPNVRYTGWDMVLTPKGWCVMEANFSGEFMWQMFRQEGYRKELEELTGWKRKTEFWWE